MLSTHEMCSRWWGRYARECPHRHKVRRKVPAEAESEEAAWRRRSENRGRNRRSALDEVTPCDRCDQRRDGGTDTQH